MSFCLKSPKVIFLSPNVWCVLIVFCHLRAQICIMGWIRGRFQEKSPAYHSLLSDDQGFGTGLHSIYVSYFPLDWCSSTPCRCVVCIWQCMLLILFHRLTGLAQPRLNLSNGQWKTSQWTKFPTIHDYKSSKFNLHKTSLSQTKPPVVIFPRIKVLWHTSQWIVTD